ncbi:Hypp7322 [Branchiostoma lanceolatum]|uniref:Hypp7322 protein n=1 Tax=Branchiostoma lanceolatum TaxID=7740 RepID=A0A8J9YZ40_BRALA|nr:Hypp7322 [Branchiostoma lanceolatum]
MGLIEAIHPALGTIDYRQPMVKLVFIGGSFLFFSAVFLVGALGSRGYLEHGVSSMSVWSVQYGGGNLGHLVGRG